MFAVALAAKTEHAMTARQARVGGTGLCIGSLPAHSPTRTGAPRLRLPASPVTDGLDLRPTVRRLGCRVKVVAPREETGPGGHRDEGRGWFEHRARSIPRERLIGVLNAGNRRDTEAMLPYVDPEAELHSALIGGAEGNAYRGHEGVRQWMAESDAAFDVQRMEAEEWRDLGVDVLLIGRVHARGRESGVEIDSAIAWLYTLRDGKIVLARGYLDVQQPSKPPGSWSRRCRRRTSTLSTEQLDSPTLR